MLGKAELFNNFFTLIIKSTLIKFFIIYLQQIRCLHITVGICDSIRAQAR